MTIAHREQQIQRVKASSFQPELDESLDQALRSAVIEAVKITLEAALQEEVKAELARMEGERPRGSGYFQQGLDTQYGHLSNLHLQIYLQSCQTLFIKEVELNIESNLSSMKEFDELVHFISILCNS